MATIKIALDPERLTVNDLVELEGGNLSIRTMRDLLARFVVDAQGKYLEHEEGVKVIGQLNMTELKEVTAQISKEVERLQEELSPLASEPD